MNHLPLVLLLGAACHTSAAPPANAPTTQGDLQIQVVRLEHAKAGDVTKMIEDSLANRSARGDGFKVVAHADQNALVLSGTTAQIKDALEIVARLDSPTGR